MGSIDVMGNPISSTDMDGAFWLPEFAVGPFNVNSKYDNARTTEYITNESF